MTNPKALSGIGQATAALLAERGAQRLSVFPWYTDWVV